MKTKVDETARVVSYKVFEIQALYYVEDEYYKNNQWQTYNWSLYCKEVEECSKVYFRQSDEGKYWFNHADRPVHYYGERFWNDTPAFMTAEAALGCMNALIEGGWNNGRQLRVVEINSIQTVAAMVNTADIPETKEEWFKNAKLVKKTLQ